MESVNDIITNFLMILTVKSLKTGLHLMKLRRTKSMPHFLGHAV